MDDSSTLYYKMKKVVVAVGSKEPGNRRNAEQDEEEKGGWSYYGAGVVIDERGFILTCGHVVLEGLEVSVRRSDDNVFRKAEVIHRSVEEDLAILRIDEARDAGYEFCQFGSSDDIQIGMPIFAIVHFNRSDIGFLEGEVVNPERQKSHIPDTYFDWHYNKDKTFIQINNMHCEDDGSHGAPIFDSTGQVIGLIAGDGEFTFAFRCEPLAKLARWCKFVVWRRKRV